jgi:hypothetical protein
LLFDELNDAPGSRRLSRRARRTPTWPYDWAPRRYDDDDDDDDDDGHSDDDEVDDDDDDAEFDRARRALPGPALVTSPARGPTPSASARSAPR